LFGGGRTWLGIEGLEEELLVNAWQFTVGSDGEELVREVHEDAVVAGGVVSEGGLDLGGHQGRIAGGLEEVVETGEKLVARSVFQDETAADAAAEGQEVRGAQLVDEAMVAGEDDTEELVGIEVFTGEDTKLAEDGSQGFLGLVDDEDGTREGGDDVVGPAGTEGLESSPTVVRLEGYGEEVAEFAVEVHGAGLGMLDVADDQVGPGLETLAEQAEGDALAGARVAGDHDVSTVGDAEFDTSQEGIDGRTGMEGLDGHVRAKGIELEAVEGLQLGTHGVSSVSLG
jgi:hypothetical protein